MAKRSILKILLPFCFGVLVAFLVGLLVGKNLPPSQSQIAEIKAEILKGINQKFEEKVKKGLLLFPFLKEKAPEKISSFTGKVKAIDREKKIIEVEMSNIYRGGKITEFLYQPDYYLKEVTVEDETKIEKGGKEIEFKEIKEGQTIFVATENPAKLGEKKVKAKVIRVIQ